MARIIDKNETNRAIGKANLVFFILVLEKYIQSMYITVSDDAIIIEAQIPPSESGPYFSKIPSNVAREALPENGLNKIKGKSSKGIFKNRSINEKYL